MSRHAGEPDGHNRVDEPSHYLPDGEARRRGTCAVPDLQTFSLVLKVVTPILAGSVLEALDLSAQISAELQAWTQLLAPLVSQGTDIFSGRLVMVDDDTMSFLWATATQADARVRLDPETRTVVQGAVWLEESLPPETLLIGLRVPNTAGDQGPRCLRTRYWHLLSRRKRSYNWVEKPAPTAVAAAESVGAHVRSSGFGPLTGPPCGGRGTVRIARIADLTRLGRRQTVAHGRCNLWRRSSGRPSGSCARQMCRRRPRLAPNRCRSKRVVAVAGQRPGSRNTSGPRASGRRQPPAYTGRARPGRARGKVDL
jgi:hypothetical protein